MGKRRRAREYALQVLYQLDITGDSWKEGLRLFWGLTRANPDVAEFTKILVERTIVHKGQIDELIGKYAQNWDINRMSVVDRNVLRFSICELLYFEEIPVKVTINEAIEVVKTFGARDSGRFVNGILDRICKELSLT